ncbi:hypothetical protein [Rhizobium lusitanum]|uniref:Uncharacterized protein n=1 Tax=Rhizobium lusitanum TaxID=293958 RepID=A0A7X0MEA4_9HYPH|nr:hypothetical protein [Rhizobium lusitanum]MBB6487479.1 hypothetical protein [Rhizobium lusitanum]
MPDQTRDPDSRKESKQPLAKIQHSKADGPKKSKATDKKSAIVADPRNRLADGKVDPSTKERKPNRK